MDQAGITLASPADSTLVRNARMGEACNLSHMSSTSAALVLSHDPSTSDMLPVSHVVDVGNLGIVQWCRHGERQTISSSPSLGSGFNCLCPPRITCLSCCCVLPGRSTFANFSRHDVKQRCLCCLMFRFDVLQTCPLPPATVLGICPPATAQTTYARLLWHEALPIIFCIAV